MIDDNDYSLQQCKVVTDMCLQVHIGLYLVLSVVSRILRTNPKLCLTVGIN